MVTATPAAAAAAARKATVASGPDHLVAGAGTALAGGSPRYPHLAAVLASARVRAQVQARAREQHQQQGLERSGVQDLLSPLVQAWGKAQGMMPVAWGWGWASEGRLGPQGVAWVLLGLWPKGPAAALEGPPLAEQ